MLFYTSDCKKNMYRTEIVINVLQNLWSVCKLQTKSPSLFYSSWKSHIHVFLEIHLLNRVNKHVAPTAMKNQAQREELATNMGELTKLKAPVVLV